MGRLIIAHYYHQVHKMNIDETDGRSSGDGERMGGHISVSMVSPKLLIINSKQLDRGSIRSSPRDGLSSPYRLTKK